MHTVPDNRGAPRALSRCKAVNHSTSKGADSCTSLDTRPQRPSTRGTCHVSPARQRVEDKKLDLQWRRLPKPGTMD